MNHDDNTNPANTLTPELEARVVAWISGEASAFEVAELERLTTDKPELTVFKRRMQAVQGLVQEAVRPDKEPLRLSRERREKFLLELGVKESPSPKGSPAAAPIIKLGEARSAQRKRQGWMMAIAACVTVGLFVAVSIPSFQRVRRSKAVVFSLEADESKFKNGEQANRTEFLATAKEQADFEKAERHDRSTEKREMELARREERLARVTAIDQETKKRGVQPETKRPTPSDTFAPAGRPTSAPSAPQASTKSMRRYSENAPVVVRDQALVSKGAVAGGYVSSNSLDGSRLKTEPLDIVSAQAAQWPVMESKDQGAGLLADSSTYGGLLAQKSIGRGNVDKKAKQVAVPVPSDEVIALSPFKVSAEREAGAQAIVVPKPSTDVMTSLSVGIPGSDSASAGNSGAILEKNTALPAGATPADPTVCNVLRYKPSGIDNKEAETNAAKEPVSTFSLHVSDVSFQIAKDALANGDEIDRERIRPEEFYNAFNYGDPSPAMNEKISCHIEQAAHPLLQQRNLVRIAMKVAASGRGAGQPLHLTLLLDTSGSMERDDRVAVVQRAMAALVSLLGSNDEVTLIGFARQPHLLAERVPGDQAGELLKIIASTPSEGGTNLEEALKLGAALAKRHFDAAAQNRIVLLTDGAANLGNADRTQLAASIEALRQDGIALDACGVGMDGLDDAMLEALTRKSDGRYYALNTPEQADAGFARQLAGAFRPAAKNVKLQVRFNPARVSSYKLIGFEQHRLSEEDFRNDKVDAAELAAEEAAVAVYQVEPLPQGEGELGEVFVRFLDPATGQMVERSWTLPYEAKASAFDRATPTMQLAGIAALLAETLQRGEKEDVARLDELKPVVNALRGYFPHEKRVQELVTMFEQLRKLSAP